MAERIMTSADLTRLRYVCNDLANTIAGYEAARAALGSCARMLDQAEASMLLADLALGESVSDGVSGAYWFRDDPEPHVAAARSHLQRLQACLEPDQPSDPDPPADDEDDATPPALPPSSGGWRVAAGLGLIALAAYGLWRMR